MLHISDFSGKRLMIIVAHPDDEILGLGGAMNRIINSVDVVTHVVILGEGITSRSVSRDTQKWDEELKTHKNNIREAQQQIGYHGISIYDFPDNRFDSVALLDIVKVIEAEKDKFKPDIIFTHHGGDLNIDHQRTFEAVMTASRPLEHETVKTIICFETLSGTEWRASSDPKHFIPNFYIPFEEDNLQSKIAAMESYSFEKRSYPHPRSPEAIKIRAQMWGVTVGVIYAEPFTIIRHTVN
jgi:LmbE family N-acetylglucosaminyl deacetylase